MMTPDDIDVWVGLDVGKSAHHAHALDHDGNTLYDKPLKQDEKAIRTMLGKLSPPLLQKTLTDSTSVRVFCK